MKKIKNQKQAKELKFGDQYIIDIFPDDPDKVTESQIKQAAKIAEVANKAVSA